MILIVPLQFVAIEDDGFHLFVPAAINGKAALLLVDTGASRTAFDRKRISKYLGRKNKPFLSLDGISTGLGTSTMEVHYTLLEKLSIADFMITDFKAILLDMSHVNKSYKKLGMYAIDGVLGSDILMKCKAVIDYEKRMLKLKVK